MRDDIQLLRLRFQEHRRMQAPLATWRELQLEVLEAAKRVQRASAHDVRAMDQRLSTLWALMGERFWLERDPSRIESMIEAVLAELESQTIPEAEREAP